MTWTRIGSTVDLTEEYRFQTDPDGIELVLRREVTGPWRLRCDQLWSDGSEVLLAPSEIVAGQAQTLALSAAYKRIGELGMYLPRVRS